MACFGVDGLYSGHEVNIGYRPWRTTRSTAMRVASDPAAAVVVELRPGQGLGRQTVRNPITATSRPIARRQRERTARVDLGLRARPWRIGLDCGRRLRADGEPARPSGTRAGGL